MANPKIKVKRSSVEGKVPAVSQLERGELAVNSYDGKIYILKDQFSVGIATTTHTINPWNEPNGVGAGVSYDSDVNVVGIVTITNASSGIGLRLIDASGKQFAAGGGGGGSPFAGSVTGHDFRIQVGGNQNAIFKYGSGATGNLELGPASGIGITFNGASGNSNFSGISTFVDLDVDGHTFLDNVNISGVSTFSGGVKLDGSNADFDDDVKIRMGDSQDLLIFHQESNGNSIIREQGGGVLSLQTNGAYMNIWDSTNQQTMAQFTNGGACHFRHAGTTRIQTTSSGADINGTLVTDALTLGNFNMPTTLGAENTVLKSDGTNVVFGSAASATFTEKAFTATQGQTVFTDTTALPTYVQVFVNGIKIRPDTDFSKSGASITLSSGATAGDEIDIVRFD
jgi:hypothetical protein